MTTKEKPMTTKEKIAAVKAITAKADEAVKALDMQIAGLVLAVDELHRSILTVDYLLRQIEAE